MEAPEAAVPGSIGQALEQVRSAMGYLADADYMRLPTEVQAEVLRGMHRFGAAQAAVFGRAGWAFTCAHGYDEYAQKNMGRWHVTQGRVSRTAGYAAKAWIARYEQHPQIIAALAEQDVISESWARAIAGWSNKLPEEYQQQADEILLTAARAGADEEGLARIAAELLARLAPPDEDKGKEPGRGLRLSTTFEGAGILTGDLTPGCAAVVEAVLGALAQPHGQDDLRSHSERLHDALEQAMRRLLASRLLPQRAGAPVTALVHINFADLVARDPGSVLQDRWIAGVRAQWAAERGGASVVTGDGGAWLDGEQAAAMAADAMIVPVVIGNVDITILDNLVGLCVTYHRLREQDNGAGEPGDGSAGQEGLGGPDGTPARPAPDRGMHAREMERLEKAIIGKAAALMSGPGGLASFLRRNQLGKGLDGPSLPLDVGDTDRIPPQIRRAVTIRDRHCVFPGGCDQPAIWCEPHHTVHRAHHGPTSVDKLGLFCHFHHHVVVHKWGWTITVEPDGTMTARKPDGTIFNHGPPSRPG